MAHAEPTTILTAMIDAQKHTDAAGQHYTIFTNHLQLYRVTVKITWVYNDLFVTLLLRIRGMYTLMKFIEAIGTLMIENGLQDIMKAAFRGVVKMLPGKKYSQNMRAFPIIVKELLREEFNKKNLICYADLM